MGRYRPMDGTRPRPDMVLDERCAVSSFRWQDKTRNGPRSWASRMAEQEGETDANARHEDYQVAVHVQIRVGTTT